jgi:serine protease Do
MKRVSLKYLVVSLILILATCVAGGCLYIETPPPAEAPPSPPTPRTTTPAAPGAAPGWELPPTESNAPPLPGIADVVAQVKPSVVAINTRFTGYDIFNRPFTQEGAGSGWIIDEDGIIVTNNHVIEGAKSITVTLADGRILAAEVSGTDYLTDLAIVTVNAGSLPAASLGDSSELRIGEWVVAIGNPLGLGISAKEGIVSRLGVTMPLGGGQTLYDLIETSAAINPGNSGGPLVNMAGQVIGITSVKIAMSGVEGMGYAISSRTAGAIIEGLITRGYIIRPWLGVGLHTVDQWIASSYNLAVNEGALVTQVNPGSPAAKAGLEGGDVITGFDNQKITSADGLIQAIHSAEIGKRVKLTFWRGEAQKVTYAVLKESPPPP